MISDQLNLGWSTGGMWVYGWVSGWNTWREGAGIPEEPNKVSRGKKTVIFAIMVHCNVICKVYDKGIYWFFFLLQTLIGRHSYWIGATDFGKEGE